ncbi:MAG: hypothetical protein EBY30_01490 [Rhodospirillales bacterium]|nr:hypothetical protein [Rhodospirillales bacterium]
MLTMSSKTRSSPAAHHTRCAAFSPASRKRATRSRVSGLIAAEISVDPHVLQTILQSHINELLTEAADRFDPAGLGGDRSAGPVAMSASVSARRCARRSPSQNGPSGIVCSAAAHRPSPLPGGPTARRI